MIYLSKQVKQCKNRGTRQGLKAIKRGFYAELETDTTYFSQKERKKERKKDFFDFFNENFITKYKHRS